MKTRLHLFVILTLLTSGPGCSRHGSASNLQNVPIHVDVVCYNKTGTLDSAQKVAAFDAWAASAIHQPGSTFTVWVVGDDRNACRQDFVAWPTVQAKRHPSMTQSRSEHQGTDYSVHSVQHTL